MTDTIKNLSRRGGLKAVFAAGAVALAMGVALAGTALAQTGAQKALIDSAKSRGEVGEQADGFVGVRTSTDADTREAITVTNSARRQAYANRGAEAGVSAAVAGARMFESQLLPRISSGEWYRNAQGQWVQR
ncbi:MULTISPECIES: DUF1318 domain-containing protein [Brevundimonas]|uniref:DUF1318 domain-containing protein n=1 Tax=Brevundimonas TaxID=41275 RepID=UPI000F029D97|nr:DUF1318 domain-containing protein [Brevundimonas lutea]